VTEPEYTSIDFYLKNQQGIDFDTENVTVDPSRIPGVTGFNTTAGGRHFLGIVTGGDWQIPICVVLYTSGRDMAMYIPLAGNTVDWANKRAFDDDEGDNVVPTFDATALLADISAFLDGEVAA
jgi:hypothetical protein